MRVIFSGYHNPHFPTITEYIERAFRELGHEVFSYDERALLLPGRLRAWLPRLQAWEVRRINAGLVRLAARTRCELAVVSGGHGIFADSVGALRRLGTTTALWTTDPPHNFGPVRAVAPAFDLVFCQGTEAVELLAQSGRTDARWLPMGCDPALHTAVPVTPRMRRQYGHDVVFVGSHYANRWELFRHLLDVDLHLWGPGWHRAHGDPRAREISTSMQVKPDTWRVIFSAAKIDIVIHYQDGVTPCYQASPKVFEALACGCFVLVDRQRDVLRLFQDGRHLVAFDNAEDLRAKVRYYLEHDEERRAIAEAGRAEAVAHHTYVHRVRELVSVAQTHRNDRGTR